jgi:hypothetical protein
MGWFGPGKAEVWRQLSQEIGAEFVEGGFWKDCRVQAHIGHWTVTLDSGISDEDGESPATRLRAPFVNPGGFRFRVSPKCFFSVLGELIGMHHIEVGSPNFDGAFTIKGNDESKVRELFSDLKIRQMIQDQPTIRLEVKDSKGWFGSAIRDDVDELQFQVVGVVKDVERLKSMFDLFSAVLDQLCRIGSAYKQKPGVDDLC